MMAISLKTTVRTSVIGLAICSTLTVAAMVWAYFLLGQIQGTVNFIDRFGANVSKFNLLTAELFVKRTPHITHQWDKQHNALMLQLSKMPALEGRAEGLAREIERRLKIVRTISNQIQSTLKDEPANTPHGNETREILFETFIFQSSRITERTLELRRLSSLERTRQINQMLSLAACSFLALILGGGLVLMLVTNKLLSRILGLRAVIEEIGQGNLDADIPVSLNDEVGDVFRQLHQMRLSLIGSMSELSKVNLELVTSKAELEDRVAERTAGLEAANKELEAFSYAVSHDLRSPLRGISGFSQALLEDYSSQLDDEGQSMLKRIHGATQRMNQLIGDLLKLSRLNKQLSNVSETDLSKIASEICKDLQERALGRNVTFKIEKDIKFRCDSGLMRIVLTNLFENAWKFTAKKPNAEISLGSCLENGKETLFIRDNGAGFDMKYSEGLFQPFKRLHAEKNFPGTGIGLATVARIVRLHGGKIWAEARPDEGATFYFQIGKNLPLSDDAQIAEQEQYASSVNTTGLRKTATG